MTNIQKLKLTTDSIFLIFHRKKATIRKNHPHRSGGRSQRVTACQKNQILWSKNCLNNFPGNIPITIKKRKERKNEKIRQYGSQNAIHERVSQTLGNDGALREGRVSKGGVEFASALEGGTYITGGNPANSKAENSINPNG